VYSYLGPRDEACRAYRRYLRLAGDPPDHERVEQILTSCDPESAAAP
jgi:hypothetical protein